MVKKTPVDVGSLHFDSKKDAEEYFRGMRDQYRVGQRIPEPHHTELRWLLDRNPWASEKIGCGIDHFSVMVMEPYKTRCFRIVRTDGSTTDFSFPHCVDGKDASDRQEMHKAFRALVTDDIFAKKQEYFTQNGDSEGRVPCAITGKLVNTYEAHADHAPPRTFGTLVDTFLAALQIEPSADLLAYQDNQHAPRLKDPATAEDWREFHHKMAAVRVVAKDENLKRAHEGKVRSKDGQLKLK
jgi:hypothetical protein